MFNDYSKDFLELKMIFSKVFERLNELEKNTNSISDDLREIREKLGIEDTKRVGGKRHITDIYRMIERDLKRNIDTRADSIFRGIEGLLMENDNVKWYDTRTEYGDGVGGDELYKKYLEWKKYAEPKWMDTIESIRREIKERKG